MISDSRRGFEFSRLNSFLSRAFSRQGKNIKPLELSKDLSHLNNMKVILALRTIIYVDCVRFSCIDSFRIVHNRVNELKKNLALEFPKIMIRSRLI